MHVCVELAERTAGWPESMCRNGGYLPNPCWWGLCRKLGTGEDAKLSCWSMCRHETDVFGSV